MNRKIIKDTILGYVEYLDFVSYKNKMQDRKY